MRGTGGCAAFALVIACAGGGAAIGPGDTGTDAGQVPHDAAAPSHDATTEATNPRHDGGRSIFSQDATVPSNDAAPDVTPTDALHPRDAMAPDAEGGVHDSGGSEDAVRDSIAMDGHRDADASSTAGDASRTDAGAERTVLLALAGGGTSIVGGEYHPGGTWAANTIMGPEGTSGTTAQTGFAPAIALLTPTSAIGVIGSSGSGGELFYTTWSSPGGFASFQAVAPGVTTGGAPSIAASGGSAYVVFLGTDFKHYLAVWGTSSWSVTDEPVTPPGGTQAFGPSPATIAALGADVVIAYAGNDHDLYDQTRSGSVWQPALAHGIAAQDLGLTPTLIAPTASANLMIAYVRGTDSQIMFTAHTAGGWSTPAAVYATAFTNVAVALTALPGGRAVLAYRGQDTNLYWSIYTPGPAPTWSQPAAVATPNWSTPSTPALAPGVGGMQAEMVFVDGTTKDAEHVRLSTTWSTPEGVGGSGFTCAAVTSM